jgi:hypothetical protein
MPSIQHGDATIHHEEAGQGFPILTFAPVGFPWEFLAKHTPRGRA